MIDIENVNLSDAERAAYSSGDTLKAKLLARIMDLEEELARVKDELECVKDELECVKDDADADSLKAWEYDNGPANAYFNFFFDCFEMLNCRYPEPSITSKTDKQVIFDAIVRGEG